MQDNSTQFPSHLAELGKFTVELNERIEEAYSTFENKGQKFVFSTGTINLILNELQPAEIIPYPRVCKIPNTPQWFTGIINLRGSLIPVFDIEQLVVGQNDFKRDWLIIIGNEESYASLSIHTLPTLMNLTNQISQDDVAIPDLLRPYIREVYIEDEKIFIEPEYVSLLEGFSKHFYD